ncbi:hypothetical protein [Streptomyces sp. ISL-11]|uniref:hypothetical protein n=1 Tax=Streptomyces sp. ISL-11 TaxID=2819174 RepID=UPI0020352942|nr:hypothetical protein [Streptomyces sp. ISL-11]
MVVPVNVWEAIRAPAFGSVERRTVGHALGDHAYGESGIEFLLVDRSGPDQRTRTFRADVHFLADLPEVYRDGDNARLLPTGAIYNTVLALGARHTTAEPEVYALALAKRFLEAAPPVGTADIHLAASDLSPLEAGASPPGVRHFTAAPLPRDHARVTLSRDGGVAVRGGLRDVELFVTAGATFTGFARDEYTTTQVFTDRVFGARLDVTWRLADEEADYRGCRSRAHQALTEAFAGHTSRSSQHTFHHLGSAVLDACSGISEVLVEGVHLTRALVDLSPFGVENEGRVYTAADAPSSTVSVVVHRA